MSELEVLTAEVEALRASNDDLVSSLNIIWVLVTAFIVFFMQAGFAMVEAGNVRSKNTQNILMKNTLDACIGAIAWWLIGYGMAFGVEGKGNGFIGTKFYALKDFHDYHSWMFQYAFSATAATVVSGSMAERTRFRAYLIYSFFISAWVYPIVAHWVWSSGGWLSATKPEDRLGDNGLLDYAGCGVVHLVGGCAGFAGAVVLGPRKGRFGENGEVHQMRGQNSVLTALGVFILWFGWLGFNPGSTLAATKGGAQLASKIATNTIISSALGSVSGLVLGKIFGKVWDLSLTLNGLLAGLVAITSGCASMEPWGACIAGITGAAVYYGSSRLLLKLKIDDPVDAVPVHLFCGGWGLIITGLLATKSGVMTAYARDDSLNDYGLFTGGNATQFGVQLLGFVVIAAWSLFWTFSLFLTLKYFNMLRVSEDAEMSGLDTVEHGGPAYSIEMGLVKDDKHSTLHRRPTLDDRSLSTPVESNSF